MKVVRKLVFACVVLSTLGACALSEEIVPVTYTAPVSAAAISPQGKAFKLEVADNRGVYRGQIGAKVNGFGQEMAAIRSSVPVREIVRNALIGELKARNISVDNGLSRALTISITAMHNNFKTGFASGSARGIVAFTVKVHGPDGARRFDGVVSEVYELPDIMLATGPNAAKAVEGALAKALKTLFENQKFISALVAA